MNFEEAMKKLDGHGLDAVVLMPRVHDSTVLARIFRRDYSHGGFSYSDEAELRNKAKSGDFNEMIVYHRGQKKDVIPLNADAQIWVVKTNRGYYRVPGNPNFTRNKGMATHYRTREGAEHDAQMINKNPSPEWNVDARVEAMNADPGVVKNSKFSIGDKAIVQGAFIGYKNYSPVRVTVVDVDGQNITVKEDENGRKHTISDFELAKFKVAKNQRTDEPKDKIVFVRRTAPGIWKIYTDGPGYKEPMYAHSYSQKSWEEAAEYAKQYGRQYGFKFVPNRTQYLSANSTRPQITNPIVKNAIGIEMATNATKTEPEVVAAFRAGCKKSVKKISEGLEELKQHVLSHENLLAGQSAEFQKAIEDILDIAIPVMKIKRL